MSVKQVKTLFMNASFVEQYAPDQGRVDGNTVHEMKIPAASEAECGSSHYYLQVFTEAPVAHSAVPRLFSSSHILQICIETALTF